PSGGQGTTALANAAPGYVFTNNVLSGIDASQYPTGNFGPSNQPNDDANIGYVDAAGGDFRLSASSPFHQAGTDGTDIGADVDEVDAATKGVTAGSATAPIFVTIAGSGTGTVTSTPAGINCPGLCSFGFPVGMVVTLIARPSPTSIFTGWSGGGCSGNLLCSVTVSATTSVTATFEPLIALTVSTVGSGLVWSSPFGISCGDTCTASFVSDEEVTLTAAPAAGSVFSGWSGG